MGFLDRVGGFFRKKETDKRIERSAMIRQLPKPKVGKVDPLLRLAMQAEKRAIAIDRKYKEIARQKRSRPKLYVGEMMRLSPGGRHAWFKTDNGLIRKPYVGIGS